MLPQNHKLTDIFRPSCLNVDSCANGNMKSLNKSNILENKKNGKKLLQKIFIQKFIKLIPKINPIIKQHLIKIIAETNNQKHNENYITIL